MSAPATMPPHIEQGSGEQQTMDFGRFRFAMAGAAALLAAAVAPAHAELSAEELAELAQNPVGSLVSVPF